MNILRRYDDAHYNIIGNQERILRNDYLIVTAWCTAPDGGNPPFTY